MDKKDLIEEKINATSYQTDGSKVTRQSGIELLKIFATVIIILSHVMQTLSSVSTEVPYNDYVLDISHSTTNPMQLILLVLMYCANGNLGNAIFFLCSAWFLLDKSVSSNEKILRFIIDVWVISICILVPVLIIRKGDLGFKFLIKSIFPTLFANNWYVTCYILFLFIYPYLNKLIAGMTQREFLGVAIFLVTIYIGINFFISAFFISEIIVWIALYLMLAYIKKYTYLTQSTKFAATIISLGIIGNILIAILTNFIGLKIDFFADKTIYWLKLSNPFFIMIALGALVLFSKVKFQNRFVNNLSSLSLLIYILHENLLLRTYYRPLLWHEIYLHFGYDYVLAWVFAIAIAIFIASVIISWVYSKTIQKLTQKISNKLFVLLKKLYAVIEEKIFKVPKN